MCNPATGRCKLSAALPAELPPPPPILHCQPVSNVRQPSVHLFNPDDIDMPQKLHQPIVRTLQQAFRRRAAECGWQFNDLPLIHYDQGAQLLPTTFANMSRGDIFIWAGYAGNLALLEHATARAARARGARIIFYWPEPWAPTVRVELLDEMWFYSKRILRLTAATHTNHSVRMRYVPPGFVPPPGWSAVSPPSPPLHTRGGGPPPTATATPLIMIGSKFNAPQREQCLRRLETHPCGVAVEHLTNVHTDAEWVALAADATKRNGVFVNLHRYDSPSSHRLGAQALETFRVSKLLSLGLTVLTEPSADEDLHEYDGMVLEEPRLCKAKGEGERALRHDTCELLRSPMRLARWRGRAAAAFRRRFAPEELLRRAGVWL